MRLCNIGKNELLKGLNKVKDCVSKDKARPQLQGILFELIGKDSLRVVGCDGGRLAFYDCKSANTNSPDKFIIEAKDITTKIKKLGDSIAIDYDPKDNALRFNNLKVKIIEGLYPDYRLVISDMLGKATDKVVISTSEAMKLLKSIEPVTSKPYCVSLTLDGNNIKAVVNNPELGEAEAEIEAQYSKHFEMLVGLNIYYLIDALKTCESLELGFKSAKDPIVLKSEDLNYYGLIMPMKT